MLVQVGSLERAGGSQAGHDLQHSEFDLIYFPLAAAKESNSPNTGRAGQVTQCQVEGQATIVCPSSSSLEEGQDQLRKAEVVGHHQGSPHCSPSHTHPLRQGACWRREEQCTSSGDAMLCKSHLALPTMGTRLATSETGLLPSSDQLGMGPSSQFATRWHQINWLCGDTLGSSGPPPPPNRTPPPITLFLCPPPRPAAAGAAHGAMQPARAQGYLHWVLCYLVLAVSDKAPSHCVFICCWKIK